MNDSGRALATVVACDGETEGLLVLPSVARAEPPSRSRRCARVQGGRRPPGGCLSARGSQARMLARAQASARRGRPSRAPLEPLVTRGRSRPAATPWRRHPSRALPPSASTRRHRGACSRPSTAPDGRGRPDCGSSPRAAPTRSPTLARAHLAGSSAKSPLVLVDATSRPRARPGLHGRIRRRRPWPLADVQRLLVLLDGAALPADVQRLVARAWPSNGRRGSAPIASTCTRPDHAVQPRCASCPGPPRSGSRAPPRRTPRDADRPSAAARPSRGPARHPHRLPRPGGPAAVLGDRSGISTTRPTRGSSITPSPVRDAELIAIAQRLVARSTRRRRPQGGDIDVLSPAPGAGPRRAGGCRPVFAGKIHSGREREQDWRELRVMRDSATVTSRWPQEPRKAVSCACPAAFERVTPSTAATFRGAKRTLGSSKVIMRTQTLAQQAARFGLAGGLRSAPRCGRGRRRQSLQASARLVREGRQLPARRRRSRIRQSSRGGLHGLRRDGPASQPDP